MDQCRATKPNGERCRGSATGPHGFCWAHDPKHAEQRSRQASRAAKAKPIQEIKDLKAQLEYLVEDVLEGRREKDVVIVANQLLNTRLRAIEIERRVKETEEQEERLRALEAQSWGS
jgi:hypothetical protein